MPKAKEKSEYSIQTVTNALRLLEVFEKEDELGVSELARRLGLHKNNVFRLLATLEESGYIEQNLETESYRLGARCLQLGQLFARGQDLIARARPVLAKLSNELGETVHLAVLRDYRVLHLEGEQPDRLLVCSSRVGRHLPPHCTALGKVLIAFSADDLQRRYDSQIVSRGGLTACAPGTIVDGSKLFEHLRSVRMQGFALDLEEADHGVCCTAAPVRDVSGAVVAGISVSGPSCRLSEDAMLRHTVGSVTEAADDLSRSLGYTAPA